MSEENVSYSIGDDCKTKDEVLGMIIDIAYDYDGYRTPEGLMSLVDELVEYAKFGLKLKQ
jgi:hypothetical protein